MVELFRQPTITESDLCEIARVSTGRKKRSDEELIQHLIDLCHDSIFEHATMTFYVKCPIYTARQWMRHRIGSFTEKSGRYSQMKDYEATISTEDQDVVDETLCELFGYYTEMVNAGTKKEEARQVLPLCTLTEFYWTVNLRSLMNFLSNRADKHAQKDISENAEQVSKIFKEYYPNIFAAWKKRDDDVKRFLSERRGNAK